MKYFVLALSALVLVGCQNTATQSDTSNTVQIQSQASNNTAKVSKVVIEEWFDYGCGYCQQAHNILTKLKGKYGDKLEVRERHFPLSARTALFAEASECARAQGKFAEFHDEVFANYFGKFEVENISKIADTVDIPDRALFDTCVKSGAEKDAITTDVRDAEKRGVKGTPFFLINDQISIPGGLTEAGFESILSQILES